MNLNRIRSGLLTAMTLAASAVQSNPVPDQFPLFKVPGQEQPMELFREIFWLHYPSSGPKATLWDIWLPRASLWPAIGDEKMRDRWAKTLTNRRFDAEGYVVTNQHSSIAHQDGWPFPFWNQGRKGFGWHFSFHETVGPNWRPSWIAKPDDWTLDGANSLGISERGWDIELTSTGATITAPAKAAITLEAPFVQLRWAAEGLKDSQPYLEWTTPTEKEFSHERRMYFDTVDTTPTISYTMIPVFKHPKWNGDISQLRIGFDNAQTGARVCVQALFAQYDTRHNVNNQSYIHGCCEYFWWTRDLSFLRANINKMRLALRYLMTEHGVEAENVVHTKWIGHDGKSGLEISADGKKTIHTGQGVGNNYWDLLPFGGRDAYATILYYAAATRMAQLEKDIDANPGWNIPAGPLKLDAEKLQQHAEQVKQVGNEMFWNDATGRFVPSLTPDNQKPDYGLTFLNLEAIYYKFSTDEHAKSIMEWMDGKREVAGDTSLTTDIYRWRFGPRATTKRNLEYYHWAWNMPEQIPWGGQVQDGGAVFGFSYHDLMARVQVLGADNAWQRLKEILDWYAEVKAAGGYRKYYDGTREGTMQGGNVAGGLGLDHEFFESVLVPQVMLDGFVGFNPTGHGFSINPQLPKEWPSVSVNKVHVRDQVLAIDTSTTVVVVSRSGPTPNEPWIVTLPANTWSATLAGKSLSVDADKNVQVNWGNETTLTISAPATADLKSKDSLAQQ